MTTWALIPAKSFARGKSRLSSVLTDSDREAFAQQLFSHVVKTVSASPSVDHVAVVTADDDVAGFAESLGVEVLVETTGAETLADVVDASLQQISERGGSAAIVCMADLPEFTADDVTRIYRGLDEANIVLVPDLERLGTNILALRPPTCMPSCFGHEDSFDRHLKSARQKGLNVYVHFAHGGSFDVDHPGDLKRMSTVPPPPIKQRS